VPGHPLWEPENPALAKLAEENEAIFRDLLLASRALDHLDRAQNEIGFWAGELRYILMTINSDTGCDFSLPDVADASNELLDTRFVVAPVGLDGKKTPAREKDAR